MIGSPRDRKAVFTLIFSGVDTFVGNDKKSFIVDVKLDLS